MRDTNDHKYCKSLTSYSRFKTRIVNIGDVPMGGNYPIRIQTMTNTNTLDTKTTVEQCIRCIEAGAEYIRLTAQGIREAKNLADIKNELRKRGYKTPLIADIHFNPKVAEIAAAIVEKIRINPGNYSDTRKIKRFEYTNEQYRQELEKINDKLLPLIKICKHYGTAIRIGVNHGSLSDRIVSLHGDTPLGMVESAMEFIRICQEENFHQLVISLKASNTRVMVYANRLLVNRMMAEGMNYPLHLGVTEAGEGEDGRIKSAVGIGTLLADGIGDTVRVSLTEDPEAEIPVAKALVKYFFDRKESEPIPKADTQLRNPFEYQKRETIAIENIGGKNPSVVIADWSEVNDSGSDLIPDYFYLRAGEQIKYLPQQFKYIWNLKEWFLSGKPGNVFPLYTDAEFIFYGCKNEHLNFVVLSTQDKLTEMFKAFKKVPNNVVLILETFNMNGLADQRALLYQLVKRNIKLPVIINRNYCEENIVKLQLKAASDVGSLLIDGFGDGLWLRNTDGIRQLEIVSTELTILQASRVRNSKTEYISCPSCGRTLFDLQSVVSQVKARTNHLKHLKIAIMGCIVNGPGEMADADYGYVGAANGKVTLYKGKEVIKRNISSEVAIEELVQLIKENGDWIEKKVIAETID
jgi:(E)-4-hydroxy-3-methylbut-2-enyl-diphosphate synthase